MGGARTLTKTKTLMGPPNVPAEWRSWRRYTTFTQAEIVMAVHKNTDTTILSAPPSLDLDFFPLGLHDPS